VSNSLDLGETPSVSPGSKLFAYGTLVVLGGLRVKHSQSSWRLNAKLSNHLSEMKDHFM